MNRLTVMTIQSIVGLEYRSTQVASEVWFLLTNVRFHFTLRFKLLITIVAGQVQNKAKNVCKVADLVLPVGTVKGHLEELGISPREEKNKGLMCRAGDAGDGG